MIMPRARWACLSLGVPAHHRALHCCWGGWTSEGGEVWSSERAAGSIHCSSFSPRPDANIVSWELGRRPQPAIAVRPAPPGNRGGGAARRGACCGVRRGCPGRGSGLARSPRSGRRAPGLCPQGGQGSAQSPLLPSDHAGKQGKREKDCAAVYMPHAKRWLRAGVAICATQRRAGRAGAAAEVAAGGRGCGPRGQLAGPGIAPRDTHAARRRRLVPPPPGGRASACARRQRRAAAPAANSQHGAWAAGSGRREGSPTQGTPCWRAGPPRLAAQRRSVPRRPSGPAGDRPPRQFKEPPLPPQRGVARGAPA